MDHPYLETPGTVYKSPWSKIIEDVTVPQHGIELKLAVFSKLCPVCRQCYANSTLKCQGLDSKLCNVVVSNFDTVTSNEFGGCLRK
jgi:hypothetical protein